ncbi:tRNA 2-thiouridine(34) synthase MnmA [Actinomycetospora straminea]|uniref:tRNA 2-thiouridine(34) synthase MnmA n=1 Tax=Actinomycetospora straminea TaxID=663607 RepID=UPI0023652AB3|nr:tRNA 2-thiouridine(34) synthase MnmA [Actinomycetospora straminea]MDD7933585.1 tRNA 2-thiouridine(34) synthase MnmA [Actinomycetospora straminea]
MRVLAAMSGGVDSAVAAARLRDAGHEVTGVHLALSAKPATMREGARGCCSIEDSRDARRCADVLDIPFYVWDMAARFRDDVVEPFVAEYAAGRTPNPCLRCNEKIKFSAVLERARALGFDAVGTGHYARLSADGVLRRAADPDKDQSYVLGVLRPDQLDGALFPLGDSVKSEVRAEAAARGLVVAEKPDSHDICFIPSGDTRGFLAERIDAAPGEMVDPSGAVVGHHRGVHDFTVGQRHGLGIARPAPDGRPRYVLGLEPVSRTVRVGPAEDLDVTTLRATDPVWLAGAPADAVACVVQVRAHGGLAPATVRADGEGVEVVLAEPLRGVAPGQAAVFYRPEPGGDVVLGSATIASTGR